MAVQFKLVLLSEVCDCCICASDLEMLPFSGPWYGIQKEVNDLHWYFFRDPNKMEIFGTEKIKHQLKAVSGTIASTNGTEKHGFCLHRVPASK